MGCFRYASQGQGQPFESDWQYPHWEWILPKVVGVWGNRLMNLIAMPTLGNTGQVNPACVARECGSESLDPFHVGQLVRNPLMAIDAGILATGQVGGVHLSGAPSLQ